MLVFSSLADGGRVRGGEERARVCGRERERGREREGEGGALSYNQTIKLLRPSVYFLVHLCYINQCLLALGSTLACFVCVTHCYHLSRLPFLFDATVVNNKLLVFCTREMVVCVKQTVVKQEAGAFMNGR